MLPKEKPVELNKILHKTGKDIDQLVRALLRNFEREKINGPRDL
jgi:hypothetical protein